MKLSKRQHIIRCLPAALETPKRSMCELIASLQNLTGINHIPVKTMSGILKDLRTYPEKLGWYVSYHSNRDGYVIVTVYNLDRGKRGTAKMRKYADTVLREIYSSWIFISENTTDPILKKSAARFAASIDLAMSLLKAVA